MPFSYDNCNSLSRDPVDGIKLNSRPEDAVEKPVAQRKQWHLTLRPKRGAADY